MRDELHIGDLRSRPVVDRAGDDLGRVVDAVLDPTTLRVERLLVRLPRRSLLQPGRVVEIDAGRVRWVGDHVVLDDVGLAPPPPREPPATLGTMSDELPPMP